MIHQMDYNTLDQLRAFNAARSKALDLPCIVHTIELFHLSPFISICVGIEKD